MSDAVRCPPSASVADSWGALRGVPIGPAGSLRGPGVVSASRIDDWLQVVGGDRTPGVAPSSMLPVWTMPGYAATADGSRWAGAGVGLHRLRVTDGLDGILATDLVQEYDRPLRVAESVHLESVVEHVSGLRATAVGPGRFVRFTETFFDAVGRRVGRQAMTLLYFGVRAEPGRVSAISEVEPDRAARRLEIAVTASFVVAGALATRDFERVHHDSAHAQAHGAPDVVVNILTHLGLCERLVRDEAGLDVRIGRIALQLHGPAIPGDRVVYTLSMGGCGATVGASGPRGAVLSADVTFDRSSS